jgi:hypothetical protein
MGQVLVPARAARFPTLVQELFATLEPWRQMFETKSRVARGMESALRPKKVKHAALEPGEP